MRLKNSDLTWSHEAEKRHACQHSTFMFHGVGFDAAPGARLEEKLLREKLDSIEADHKRIADVIADRTELSSEAIQELFLEQKTKDAEFAAQHGIIHEIREVSLPSGAPIISIMLQG